jgi:hypothetical protein
LQATATQTPPTQPGVPLAAVQTLPTAPQLLASVLRLTSQPLAMMPSRSAKPVLHTEKPQVPAVHSAAALAKEHALPQAPQWLTSEARVTSQPSPSAPLQLARPAVQTAAEHAPAMQVRPPVQTNPQAPQLLPSLVLSISQPLAALPSQLLKPVAQVSTQAPAAHEAALLAPEGHALPQVPQWPTSLRRSRSQPLGTLPSQLSKLASQEAMVHRPAAQPAVPLVAEQRLPTAPQWSGLVARFTSQPLAAMPSTSAKPSVQLPMAQAPAAQTGAALSSEQALPQAPQLRTSVCASISQPSVTLVLQSR